MCVVKILTSGYTLLITCPTYGYLERKKLSFCYTRGISCSCQDSIYKHRYAATQGRRTGASLHPHWRASVPACPRPQVCWSLNIFGLYSGYTLFNHGISSQLDSGGAKESNCAASEFNPAEIDDDLHKRISPAVHNKLIKSFDMHDSAPWEPFGWRPSKF